jgi:hypothetical protein
LDIIKLELKLVESDEFYTSMKSTKDEEIQSMQGFEMSSNYYLKTIDKLLNKCIFNGDDKCDCKKCQWLI